jgi:hypothetical protein
MMTTPQDIAEEKNATFILFSTTDKLTRTELKKAFRVKKGRLLSTKGKNWQVGNLFDQLNAVKNSLPDEGKYFNFDGDKHVTHIYIVAQRSCTKTFGLVRYFDQFLGGYDVSPSALKQLEILLDEYRDVASFCGHGKGSISGLNVRANQIAQKGIGDSNKIQNLITQLKVEFDQFANPNLEKAKEKINLWREQHRWSDIDSQSSAQNDAQSQLAA